MTDPTDPEPTACPFCEGRHVLPICYGYPSNELLEEAAAGRVLLGGCGIGAGKPQKRCMDCGYEFDPMRMPSALGPQRPRTPRPPLPGVVDDVVRLLLSRRRRPPR